MNLGYFLDKAADRVPEKTAVICEGRSATYRALKRRSDSLAASLARRGILKGARVALLAHNSIEYIETLFALMKLGAVCVPINTRLTAAETAVLLDHCRPAGIVYDRELAEKVSGDTAAAAMRIVIGGDQDPQAFAYESFVAAPATPCDASVTEDDPSCIIYTAGTTGSPKGVVLTHGNQLWNTLNYTAAYALCPEDIELAPTPLFHSSTLGRVFTYVFNTAAFILCRKFDPDACLELIQREKVTSVTQAPTMYHMMHEAARRGCFDLGSVRRAVTGASLMTQRAKQQLAELFPEAACYDLYGITEAAPGVAILQPRDFLRKSGSVGQPMLCVETAIVNEAGDFLSAEQIGEILCRGPNVMQGYYHNPEATAAALRNGWLHTGDMGFIDAEGFLHIVARKKELIISGGVNIYPGEVEQVLMQHAEVADAAVIGVPDEQWGEKVVAAVVLRDRGRCDADGILSFCKKRLAGFKCPRALFFIDSLPRNAAQKVLKNELESIYRRLSEEI